MRICFISPYPPQKGGISIYTERLVTNLRNSKVNVEVIGSNTFIFFNIFNYIRKNKPDILRVEYAISMYGFSSLWIYLNLFFIKIFFKNIKVTTNLHEIAREIEILGFIARIYYYIFLKVFDRIYVHTQEGKNKLINKCHVKKNIIKIIPHGTYQFKNKTFLKKEIEDKYRLKNKKVILYFGYITSSKGIEYLISATNKLVKNEKKIADNTLTIIAGCVRQRKGFFKIFGNKDKKYLESLKNDVGKNNLEEHIKFLGFIEDKYVYSLFKRAKLVILPYNSAEQSGVLNLALATNKVVIATKTGGLKESLKDIGILIPKQNSQILFKEIVGLLKNQSKIDEVEHKYKKIVQKENSSKINQILINDFEKILKTK
ncbi:glycosyltransferase [Patescibacteria group bacterium]|nr:glycosyltransferase [Patescibacteria group bacterium]